MRTVVAASMLLAALAGCLTDSDAPREIVVPTRDDGTDDAGGAGGGPGAGSWVGAPVEVIVPPNHAPSLSLQADAVEGTAPLTVAFLVEGEDADDDPLRWTLDVDSDGVPEAHGTGSLLPFTYNYTFGEPATAKATATLTDGEDAASADLVVVAKAGTPRAAQSGTGPNQQPRATLAASAVEGAAPLNVVFSMGGFDYDTGDSLTWSLDTNGDGTAEATGTTLPATFSKQFGLGLHQVKYRVTDGKAAATVALQVRALPPTVVPPDLPSFRIELGPSAGCEGTGSGDPAGVPEGEGAPCANRDLAGPSSTTTADGHWVPLEAAWALYRLENTETGTFLGDTECEVFNVDATVILANGNNGEGPCLVEVLPPGSAWLYIYSWMAPSTRMEIILTPP